MNRILIIGYGNPHRGDDGVGYHAAEQFEAMNKDHVTVQTIATEELKPEMVEDVSKSDLVVFIDASNNRGEPGTVWGQEIRPDDDCDGVFSHDLTPCVLLAASKVIYHRVPEAVLICIKGENFGFSAHLSPAVEAALPKVFDRLNDIIRSAREREAYVAPMEQAGV